MTVALLGSTDPAAVREVARSFVDRLYDFALVRLANPERAALAVHNALVTGHRRADTLADSELIATWLYALTRCECERLLWPPSQPTELIAPPGPALPRPIQDFLAALDKADREIFELAVRHQRGIDDVAMIVGSTPRAVQVSAESTRAQMLKLGDYAVGRFAESSFTPASSVLVSRVLTTLQSAEISEGIAVAGGPYAPNGFPAYPAAASTWSRWRRPALAVAVVLALLVAGYALGTDHSGSGKNRADATRSTDSGGEVPPRLGRPDPSVSATPSPSPTPAPTSAAPSQSAAPAPPPNPPAPPPPVQTVADAEPKVMWADIKDTGANSRCGMFWAQVNVGIDRWDLVSKVTAYIWSSDQVWEVDISHRQGEQGTGRLDLPRNTRFNYVFTIFTKDGRRSASGIFSDFSPCQ